jgi:hypothetical protein
MGTTALDLFRSVREEQFGSGTVIEGKPAPEILYPDFEPRELPSGKIRAADVKFSDDTKEWVKSGGGTSLFDKANVFKSKKWLSFTIPSGTEVPDSLNIRETGYNKTFQANHYQIESAAKLMRVDAYKGALDNLARNAVVRSIALSEASK